MQPNVKSVRAFRYRPVTKAIVLLLASSAAYALWQLNTVRLRQDFIAEIERRGGTVVVDSGVPFVCGSPGLSGSAPTPNVWDKLESEYTYWRRKGTLISADLPGALTRQDAERMSLLATMYWLTLAEADDAALAALPTFPQLERLTLHSTTGTDAALVCLTRMPMLGYLKLRGRGFTDVTEVIAHPHLEAVDLADTSLSEQSFAALVTHPRVREVSADRTGVTGSSLLSIPAEQMTVAWCYIAGNPFAEQALVKLYAAPGLDLLDASGIHHGPNALAALAANRTITELLLNDIPTDWDRCVAALSSMTQLEKLSLQGAKLNSGHLKQLLRLPKLKKLQLERSTVTHEMYEQAATELDEEFDDTRHWLVTIESLLLN